MKFKKSPDLVFFVFDELPTASLLTPGLQLDRMRFPGFAKFAKDSVWFRNATSTSSHTTEALLAMLTGRYFDEIVRFPTSDTIPNNLFTALYPQYDFHVQESVIRLCPPSLCPAGKNNRLRQQCYLLTDITVVAAHAVLPSFFHKWLPDISHTWRNFVEPPALCENFEHVGGNQRGDQRLRMLKEFIGGLEKKEGPTIYFLNVVLPHRPWSVVEAVSFEKQTGYTLHRPTGKKRSVAKKDYDLHLLHAQMIDFYLEQGLTKLRELGIYDSALIVVTADHGINFWPDDPIRMPDPKGRISDIMHIPLLVKLPNSQITGIRDENVELIDVLPIVEGVLGQKFLWKHEGRNPFGKGFRPREKKKMSIPSRQVMSVRLTPQNMQKSVDLKWELFR